MLAELDGVDVKEYLSTSETDIVVAAAIFMAMVCDDTLVQNLPEVIGVPKKQVDKIVKNLKQAQYIVKNKINMYIKEQNEESYLKEFNLFCLAGTGVVVRM